MAQLSLFGNNTVLTVGKLNDMVEQGNANETNITTNAEGISDLSDRIDDEIIGIGQTWQDVKVSRSLNTIYTNSTTKPIYVMISLAVVIGFGDGLDNILEVQGVEACINRFPSGTGAVSDSAVLILSAIVPPGSTYRLVTHVSNVLYRWAELR